MPARDVRERGRHDANRESVREGDEKEVRPARGDNRSRADENQCKGPGELGNPLPPRGDRHLAAPPGRVATPSICSLFGGPTKRLHLMYDADPRSNPGTNSKASWDGCHAASGNTKFGKNSAG